MPSLVHLLQNLVLVSPIVNLGYATYRGTTVPDTGIDSFLGIRYAAPPIGNMRFQAPIDPVKENQIVEANTMPPVCPQANQSHPLYTQDYRGNEDCLYLNVFKPTNIEDGRKLPVMVWLHEGGYAAGGNYNHDPSFLISLSNFSMVVVTVQYRLGAFGFLASSEVGWNGALNAGLLDQKFALEWIQKHVAQFGGDPDQVTIWGLSAGGGSVLNHVVAYNGSLGTSLFRGAIANSPYLPPVNPFDSPIEQGKYQRFVEEAGCDTHWNTFKCLLESDTDTLMKANAIVSTSGPTGTLAWGPVLDYKFLVSRPSEQLLTGNVNGERLIAGSNTHELLMRPSFNESAYVFLPSNITTEEDLKKHVLAVFPNLPETIYPMLQHFYPAPENSHGLYSDMQGRMAAIAGELILNCPSYWLAQAFPEGKSYHYEWQIPPATHGQDMIAIFPDDFPSPPQAAPLRLVYDTPMISFIIHDGDPNILPKEMFGELAPFWPPYSSGLQAQLTMKGPKISGSNDLGREDRCAFWRSVGSVIPY